MDEIYWIIAFPSLSDSIQSRATLHFCSISSKSPSQNLILQHSYRNILFFPMVFIFSLTVTLNKFTLHNYMYAVFGLGHWSKNIMINLFSQTSFQHNWMLALWLEFIRHWVYEMIEFTFLYHLWLIANAWMKGKIASVISTIL